MFLDVSRAWLPSSSAVCDWPDMRDGMYGFSYRVCLYWLLAPKPSAGQLKPSNSETGIHRAGRREVSPWLVQQLRASATSMHLLCLRQCARKRPIVPTRSPPGPEHVNLACPSSRCSSGAHTLLGLDCLIKWYACCLQQYFTGEPLPFRSCLKRRKHH